MRSFSIKSAWRLSAVSRKSYTCTGSVGPSRSLASACASTARIASIGAGADGDADDGAEGPPNSER